jgi:hypothetical protein
VFGLEEFRDAVFRAFAAGAALLDAAEGRDPVEMTPSLLPTMPHASACATCRTRPMSRLQAYDSRSTSGYSMPARATPARADRQGAALAADHHLGAFLERVGDVALDLSTAFNVDQRS